MMSYIFHNQLKENLKAGKTQIGAFITAPCPEVVEVLGVTGYDFVILDTEHTASDIETVVAMMRAAEVYGMTPVVRVPDDTPKNISRYQDVGAYGVQVPMVHTAQQGRRHRAGHEVCPRRRAGYVRRAGVPPGAA